MTAPQPLVELPPEAFFTTENLLMLSQQYEVLFQIERNELTPDQLDGIQAWTNKCKQICINAYKKIIEKTIGEEVKIVPIGQALKEYTENPGKYRELTEEEREHAANAILDPENDEYFRMIEPLKL